MKKFYVSLFLSFTLFGSLFAQPGTVKMTPIQPILGGLKTQKIIVPSKFSALLDTNRVIQLANGFEARLFYMGGLTKPRVLEFNDSGVLHVIDYRTNGAVYALPDKNNDDVADTLLPVVTGVNAHDFKFFEGAIYVAEETRVLKCTDTNKDGLYETKEVFINNIANGATGGHRSRTILFDKANGKLYLSIGSLCNVCRETEKAIIEEYNLDGTGRKVWAKGTRNAVGLMLHPKTGKVWANNNGSDRQGNDVPPEWIDEMVPNGFYGYPFAYGHQVWFNMDAHSDYSAMKPITAADSALVATMHQPKALIQAHSAPMELEYVDMSSSMVLNAGIIMALRGSWNRTPATGYKLVFLNQQGDYNNVASVSDFLTGFLTDSNSGTHWARPVGIAVKVNPGNKADIYMSSDAQQRFVLKLKNTMATAMDETQLLAEPIRIYPNPFGDLINLSVQQDEIIQISLFDINGKTILSKTGESINTLNTSQLIQGLYFLKVETKKGKILIEKIVKQGTY